MLEKILNFGKKTLAAGVIASTIFVGCEKDSTPNPTPDPTPVPLPTETILYDNVNILNSSDLGKIISYEEAQMKFSGNMNYQVGDILSGGMSEKTPYGFLLKVSSSNNGGKTYGITQASFDEAIEKGKYNLVRKITDGKKNANGKIEFSISDLILCDSDGNTNTTDDQIIMNGLIYMAPEISLDMEWEKGLKNFKFGVESEIKTSISIGTGIMGLNIQEERVIPGPEIPPFPITICGLPSVVKPKLEFIVGVEGYVSPTTISITETINQEAYVSCHNDNWGFESSTIKEFSFEEFTPPEILELKGYVQPKISFLVNYVLGPSTSVEGYLKAYAKIGKVPPWQISAGANIYMGSEMTIFGKNILNYEKKIFSFEEVLAEGEEPENTPPVAEFNINPEEGDINTDFTFDASSSYDAETSTENLEVKWDWESDGTWDTPYSKEKTVTKKFGNAGQKNISLIIKDGGGTREYCFENFECGGRKSF